MAKVELRNTVDLPTRVLAVSLRSTVTGHLDQSGGATVPLRSTVFFPAAAGGVQRTKSLVAGRPSQSCSVSRQVVASWTLQVKEPFWTTVMKPRSCSSLNAF